MKIYAQKYEEYFIKIYSDTGILSEPQILENYRQEAIKRRKEIAEIIQSRLSCNPILGHSGNNTVKIIWRTKMLHISFEDISDTERIVIDLEIRG